LRERGYIAIEGAIGVGKTTLARLIRDEFEAELLLEVFEENPFLSDFYTDRERYAFQTQIFFLLSRYRHQQQVVPETLQRSPLISDYTFAKDRLFAHLNLKDDELEMYERVHAIMAEKIPLPNLIVYLKADTDTLMQRIAFRDRTYEREMDRDYLEAVRIAYDRFFADYDRSPVLPIDTNRLDFVHNPQDLAQVVGHIRSALEQGTYQRPLPRIGPALDEADRAVFIEGRRRLGDFQRWHLALDKEKGFLTDLYFNFLCLTEEVGDLGAELRGVWTAQDEFYKKVGNRREALDRAIQERLPSLRQELADCLAFLLRLANYMGIDLEEAFIGGMKEKRRMGG
jgi:deoxyadenosine/deoxycytidine kinase/NTP pyrophosphatase (non-canonical NTP hydrolase)